MLNDRQGHAIEVRLLEGSLADELLIDLTGDTNQRDRVHMRIGNGGY